MDDKIKFGENDVISWDLGLGQTKPPRVSIDSNYLTSDSTTSLNDTIRIEPWCNQQNYLTTEKNIEMSKPTTLEYKVIEYKNDKPSLTTERNMKIRTFKLETLKEQLEIETPKEFLDFLVSKIKKQYPEDDIIPLDKITRDLEDILSTSIFNIKEEMLSLDRKKYNISKNVDCEEENFGDSIMIDVSLVEELVYRSNYLTNLVEEGEKEYEKLDKDIEELNKLLNFFKDTILEIK